MGAAARATVGIALDDVPVRIGSWAARALRRVVSTISPGVLALHRHTARWIHTSMRMWSSARCKPSRTGRHAAHAPKMSRCRRNRKLGVPQVSMAARVAGMEPPGSPATMMRRIPDPAQDRCPVAWRSHPDTRHTNGVVQVVVGLKVPHDEE